ncbi:MAG: transcription elongation factor GreA [Alphaproteobacteria bacterium]|nr:transcription elongation factor GreA [Alphaproteobacteria bacterium]
MDKVPIRREGLERLQEELRQLKSVDRPQIIRAIAEAREHGDLSENAEYHAARERQSFIEGRVAELESAISRAEVIDVSQVGGGTVTFGTTVTVADEETDEETAYTIVGPYEADISRGLISTSSPIARALIGRQVGDSVEVITPRGAKSFEVLDISVS